MVHDFMYTLTKSFWLGYVFNTNFHNNLPVTEVIKMEKSEITISLYEMLGEPVHSFIGALALLVRESANSTTSCLYCPATEDTENNNIV